MSRAQSEQRTNSKSDGGIAIIWLILYAIGFLDILAFKPSHKAEVASARPAIHTLAVVNDAD
jgi:hypothetical protein